MGRAAIPAVLSRPDSPSNPGGPYPLVGPSAIPIPTADQSIIPRPLTHEEILEYIDLYGQAVHRAGFDGVEIHGGDGCLVDQFIQDVSNKRTDQWGGSIENRIRFPLEVIKKVVSIVGHHPNLKCFSPRYEDGSSVSGFRGTCVLSSRSTHSFSIFASQSNLAWLRIKIVRFFWENPPNLFLRLVWQGSDSTDNGTAYIGAGGYSPEAAIEAAEKNGGLVAFGRYLISNPDLPARIKKSISLTPYDRSTFYAPKSTYGYADYAFADKESEDHYEKVDKL